MANLLKTYYRDHRKSDTSKFVHNKDAQIDYHKMPVMLNPENEREWLDVENDHQDFNFPNYKPRLLPFHYEGQTGIF